MTYLLRTIRTAAAIFLSALIFCAGTFLEDARAQEAPRDSGSLIKPPTIKPPTARSQSGNNSATGNKSTKRKSRRRRARRRRATTTAAKTGNASMVLSKASGGGSSQLPMVTGASSNQVSTLASIKPPTAAAEDATLSTPRPRKPISGGVLNGKALSLPMPVYPPIAKAARASGTVVVQVLIDEEGKVVEARAISGHPLLQNAAKEAALLAQFAPTRLSGQPVQVTGVLTYNFVPD
jgi:TonB family protein